MQHVAALELLCVCSVLLLVFLLSCIFVCKDKIYSTSDQLSHVSDRISSSHMLVLCSTPIARQKKRIWIVATLGGI